MALTKQKSGLKPLTKQRAVLEMILAGILWGFGFVATIFALRVFSPGETLFYRLSIAFLLGEILYLTFKEPNFTTLREEFYRALPAGFFLGSMLVLQTIGLKYTTAGKSGFLTCLYVIIIPVLNSWVFRTKSTWQNYALVALALFGTLILVGGPIDSINIGDLWTIGCSLMAALHIIYIGRISGKIGNVFRFNNLQSFWCLLVVIPLYLGSPKAPDPMISWIPWLGILSLGIGSSLIAFYLQVRTQKVLSDSTASMLFLLESPFAALFGYLILHENLTLTQGAGAALIMLAAILQIIMDPANKKTQ